MEKFIVKNCNDQEFDTKREKARALLVDNDGNLYVCEMNDSLVLPGGTVEKEENPIDTINRELKEELGIVDIPLFELIQINYYHNNFPKYKQEGTERRLNIVYYYYSKVPIEINLIPNSFSDYEIKHNIKISRYPIEEIFSKIKLTSENKWKKFTDLEMETVLKKAIGKGIINKKQIEKKVEIKYCYEIK